MTTCVDIINRALILLGVAPITVTALTASDITETAPNGGTAANLTDGDEDTLVTTTGGASTTDEFVVAMANMGSNTQLAYVELLNLSLSGTNPAGTCTPSATTGTAITLTASSAVFAATDVGEYVSGNGGVALITGFTSTTVVTAEVLTPFIDTSAIANGSWTQYLPSDEVWVQWSENALNWTSVGHPLRCTPTAASHRLSLAVNAQYVRVVRIGTTDLGTANFSLGEMKLYKFGTTNKDETCYTLYPMVRDRMLTAYPWRITMRKSAALNKTGVTPINEWEEEYALPIDFFNGPRAVFEDNVARAKPYKLWEQFADKLLTDLDEVYIDYQVRADEGDWPDYLAALVAYVFASDSAESLTDQTTKADFWHARAFGTPGEDGKGGFFRECRQREGQQKPSEVIEDFSLITVRD